MILEITETQHNKTVKEIAHSLHISTRLLTRLKGMDDGITVNGNRVTVRHVVHEGDTLCLNTEKNTENSRIIPYNAPLEVLWEDDWYIAYAKPAHLPTHPARRHQEDTLASRAAYLHGNNGFVFRALTRLDLDTSGVVMVAKSQYAANEFSKLLASRKVKKEYTAVCLGKINEKNGVIDYPIIRPLEKSILRYSSADLENGECALTEYEVIASCDTASLLSVYPITGRTHQIRVHMLAKSHPILGDTLYSSSSPLISRQALHAHTISFTHPFTKSEISITCPLFDDMDECIRTLFGVRYDIEFI